MNSSSERLGEETPLSIQKGLDIAFGLQQALHTLESERLLEKLASISHQFHGPEHDITKCARTALRRCKWRFIRLLRKGNKEVFQALRYEGSGEKLVVKGPIAKNDCIQDHYENNPNHKIICIADTYVVGTPVICHGLKTAQHHLNGKIGDLRSL